MLAAKNHNAVGWVDGSVVNIRSKPSKKSKVISTYKYGRRIKYKPYNKKWAAIKYKKERAFICSKYISKQKLRCKCKKAPKKNTLKSYMDYRTITDRTSKQYKLQNRKAYTGKYGIRMINGRYCVAVGSYYTKRIGAYLDIQLKNGTVIPCILSDTKSDRHTDSRNRINPNGSVVEFVVKTNRLSKKVRKMGDLSYACKRWNSKVSRIRIYHKTEKCR